MAQRITTYASPSVHQHLLQSNEMKERKIDYILETSHIMNLKTYS